MVAEIPGWLAEQTKRDIATVDRALRQVESRLDPAADTGEAAAGDSRAIHRALRRALRLLEQDMRYVLEFRSGAVLRRGAVQRRSASEAWAAQQAQGGPR